MKILLVGGTGVLSTAITTEALQKNIEIYMINRGNHPELIPQCVHLFKADINDKSGLDILLNDMFFDAVIDFLCYTEKELDYSFNYFKNRTNQYVFISSCAVYSNQGNLSCDEDAPKVNPIWDYSVEKYKCEEYLIKNALVNDVNYTIIRPGVTYGNTRIPYGITPPYGYHWTIVERILEGKPIVTWNNGENYCNITHVNDFAVGLVGLLGNEKAYNEAFNIVGDDTHSWKEVLDILAELLNKEVIRFDVPSEYYADEIPGRKGEILGGRSTSGICSNQKIKSVTKDFKTTIPLKSGLIMTLDYYKNHNYINGIDYKFDGDTDRIIAKYIGNNNISKTKLNLHFIDYLKLNNRKDKFNYFIYRNKDNLIIKAYFLSKKVMGRIIRLCKKS